MKKKLLLMIITIVAALSSMNVYASWQSDYPWAVDGVNFCMSRKILEGTPQGDLMLGNNLTRSQMAKILTVCFGLQSDGTTSFADASKAKWDYNYICAIEKYMPKKNIYFDGDTQVTREEFAATLVRASGLNQNNIRNSNIIDANFDDAYDVSSDYKTLLSIAVERAYMNGSGGKIYPQNLLTRAEVCTLIERVSVGELTYADLGVRESSTNIVGEPQLTVEEAQQWARDREAEEIFINIAPIYWKYGELTGIRPEILYAQAAKETGFGRYTGAVKPEMNNWAGIKTDSATGDRTEDHETFLTPDDGVRAHFNHMSAYIGLTPIGEPHNRYFIVKSIDWAGTVKTVEALGGKWCPDLYYGYSILHDLLEPMMKYGE